MNIKEYFRVVKGRLPEFRKEMYATIRKMIYVAGVFIAIILCWAIVVRVISYRANRQQQRRSAVFQRLMTEEKQYKKGIVELRKTIKRNPGEDHTLAYFGLATAYQKLGQYEKCIVALKGKTSETRMDVQDKLLSKQDIARSRNHYDQGVAFYKEKQYKKAIKEFQSAIVSPAKDNKGAYHGLGMAHRKLKQYNKAIEYFWMTVLLSPYNAQNYAELGVTYGLRKDHDLALKNLRCAIVLRPNNADVWLNLGVAHWNLKQFNKSIECYEKAIILRPKYALAHFNLGCTSLINNKQVALTEHKILVDLDTELAKQLKEYIKTGINPEEVS